MSAFAVIPGWVRSGRELLLLDRHAAFDGGLALALSKGAASGMAVVLAVLAAQATFLAGTFHPGLAVLAGLSGAIVGALANWVMLLQRRLAKLSVSLAVAGDLPGAFALLVGEDGGIRYASPSCERLTGYTSEHFRTHPGCLDDIIHPDDRPKWARARSEAAGGRHGGTVDLRVISRDGRDVRLRATSQPVLDDEERLQGLSATFVDVTDQLATEARLADAEERAQAAARAKAEFLANMNHELRTPLNSIIGFSEILSNEILGPLGEPEYLEYARDISTSGQRLLDRINDILNVARIQNGSLALKESTLDVGLMVASCHRLLREQARAAGLTLYMDVPDRLPLLFADPRQVKDMLMKLISNGLKFTLAGGTVVCRASVDDESRFVFVVKDTGIGIAPEEIQAVLSTFVQGDGSLTRSYEGAGLGLSLSKKLAELHGGTLLLESKLGVGTTVTVRFPAGRTIRS